jgi:hypothetical protein
MTKQEMIAKLLAKFAIDEMGAEEIISSLNNGVVIDGDVYDVLFEHYCDNGEMPYGTATARDGDPYHWVSQAVADELGINMAA